MSEIFVDNNCTVCSSYGEFLNKRNHNVKVSNQLELKLEDIERDELVYVNNKKKFFKFFEKLNFSDNKLNILF